MSNEDDWERKIKRIAEGALRAADSDIYSVLLVAGRDGTRRWFQTPGDLWLVVLVDRYGNLEKFSEGNREDAIRWATRWAASPAAEASLVFELARDGSLVPIAAPPEAAPPMARA